MFNNILFFYNKNCIFSKRLKNYLYKNSKNCFSIDNLDPDEKTKKILKLNLNFDYIFCFRNYFILKKNIIEKAKFAAINFHPGTPKYRGIGCINYALYNNEKNYGSTAHLINEKIDNGPIIDVKNFKITKKMNLDDCLKKTHEIMYKQAMQIFKKLNKLNGEKELKTLIKKNKNIKWNKKIKNRKKLDLFYKINLNHSKSKIEKKIKATYIKNFYPYVEVENEYYYLLKKSDLFIKKK